MMRSILSIAWLLIPMMLHAQKISPDAMKALVAKAEATHTDAVLVYQGGEKILERYFGDYNSDTLIEAMSVTKSVVGLAVACMLDDGSLDSLDVPVHRYFPEWDQGLKKNITVRHLVNMTSGMQNVPNTNVEIYPSPDFIQLALAADLVSPPGQEFSYNNKSVNLLAELIRRITHKPMDRYIAERLFHPLGITRFTWSTDDAGHPQAMAGCQIRPADLAKLGLLVLNKGRYEGKVLFSEKAWKELVRPCPVYTGYGMLWWLDHERSMSIVDEETIRNMRAAGVPETFVKKAERIIGEYPDDRAYIAKVTEVFGPSPWEEINNTLGGVNMRLRKRRFEGKVRYRADGYLGNFIIVDPATNIVAVRMIRSSSHYNDTDDFVDFKEMVYDLTR